MPYTIINNYYKGHPFGLFLLGAFLSLILWVCNPATIQSALEHLTYEIALVSCVDFLDFVREISVFIESWRHLIELVIAYEVITHSVK